MLNPKKPKQFDPSASSQGTAGVLPHIPDADKALVTLDEEVFKQIEYEYHHGRERGQTTNNKYLDPYFKWMPGYTNVITGWPGHGKSQLFFELLLLRAAYDGKKSVVWPSENLPPKRFFQGLIHTLTGRPADKSQANYLSLVELGRAKEFIREHFILLNPSTGMGYTPGHMLAYCEAAIAKYGGAEKKKGGIAHCMLDPWNKQDHTAKVKLGGDESYLMHTVGLCTKWSQDTNQALVLTAHPKRTAPIWILVKRGQCRTGLVLAAGRYGRICLTISVPCSGPSSTYPAIRRRLSTPTSARMSATWPSSAPWAAMGPMAPRRWVPIHWDEITNRYRWGRERWSPLDDELVQAIYKSPQAAPAPQLFTGNGQPAAASPAAAPPLRTAAPAGAGFEAEASEIPAEQFFPRQITSADLP